MLHNEAVLPGTLALLKELVSLDEFSQNPNYLQNLTWEEVKQTIQKAVREYLS